MIGELGFFSDHRRTASCQSVNVTSLAYIEKDDFLDLLHEFPLDYVYCFVFLLKIGILYDDKRQPEFVQ